MFGYFHATSNSVGSNIFNVSTIKESYLYSCKSNYTSLQIATQEHKVVIERKVNRTIINWFGAVM